MTDFAAASAAPTLRAGDADHAVVSGSGSARVQSRGVLLGLRGSDGVVVHASAGVGDHLRLDVQDVLGAPLAAALGEDAASLVLARVASASDLEAVNQLSVRLDAERGGGAYDVILHRAQAAEPGVEPLVVVELEPVVPYGPGTSAVVGSLRAALADLHRTTSLESMLDVAVRAVRDLTGFDHVAVYRLDDYGNAEVVAEACPPDVGSSLGLHFPSSDLPNDARSRYLRRRVHYVGDLAAEAFPVLGVPDADVPPLDLTAAQLRALDPHEADVYHSRGARAVLSAALLHGGRLWGLVRCQTYDSPLAVPYEVRSAVEIICSVLSALSSAQLGRDRDVESRRQERVLAHLAAASRDESVPLGIAITRSGWTRRLVGADGAVIRAEGRVTTVGHVPDEAPLEALLDWVWGAGEEVVVTDCLRETAPDVAALNPHVAGVMGIVLPEGQVLVWLRDEVQRRVEWGGDPSESLPVRVDDPDRTMLRASEERWREVVDGHSLPWTDDQVESAAALRGHLLEALYLRGRKDVRATEELQRSLLPETLPDVAGWSLESRYDAAGAGLVGGDWFDALELPSGQLALVVGDVTGHGLQAAATMGQLRTALRTSLVVTCSAREAVSRLVDVASWTLPGEVATVTVAIVDPLRGTAETVSLGHPPLLLVHPDGTSAWGPKAAAPPLGIARRVPPAHRIEVPRGGALVLYSDGLVERRDETIRAGLARLAAAFAGGPTSDVDEVVAATRDERSADDATLLVLRRD